MASYSDRSVPHFVKCSHSANRFCSHWFWSHGWMEDVEGGHLRASSRVFFVCLFLVILPLSAGIDNYWKPCLSFLCFCPQFHPSWGDAVQNVLILCIVNTQIGLVWRNWCEINISVNTTPPGAFLWSIIYVLRAKKLYLKINFFAFPVFLIFKGIVRMEYLCWRLCWMLSRLRRCGGSSGGEDEIIKKREKASETFFQMWG